jgi:hypothetical protein
MCPSYGNFSNRKLVCGRENEGSRIKDGHGTKTVDDNPISLTLDPHFVAPIIDWFLSIISITISLHLLN